MAGAREGFNLHTTLSSEDGILYLVTLARICAFCHFVGRHLEDKLALYYLFPHDFSLKEGMLNQSKPSFLYLITLEIPARVLVRKSNRFRLLLLSSPGDAAFQGLVVYYRFCRRVTLLFW